MNTILLLITDIYFNICIQKVQLKKIFIDSHALPPSGMELILFTNIIDNLSLIWLQPIQILQSTLQQVSNSNSTVVIS